MKKIVILFFLSPIFMVSVGLTAVVYQDDFNDGDFTAGSMTWDVVEGGASITGDDNLLSLDRGGTLVVAEQEIQSDEYTVSFDASITWSERAMILVLYKDRNNYYAVGLGGKPGIFRVMNGYEEQLYADSARLIRLPHARSSEGTFKIYVKNDGSYITIRADRAGNGIDYDATVRDSHPEAVERFTDTTIGFETTGDRTGTPWFRVDNIVVDDTLVENPRTPLTLYVSETGNDDRSVAEAQNQSTPWRTIQKAADTALAGDTVLVMPGVYRETVSPQNAGILDAPITFKAYDETNKPVLDGSEVSQFFTWETVTITDFNGNPHQVYRTQVDWFPKSVYNNNTRMFLSQEPNQSDPDDPYNHDELREVPNAYNDPPSFTELVDPAFFVQTEPGYWAGGTLMLFQRYGNYITEEKIIDYIPAENKIIVEDIGPWAQIGPDNDDRPDKYAITNHVGILDKPGEYCLTGNTTPYFFYVWPYEGEDISTVTLAKNSSGFLIGRYRNNMVIDGFEIINYQADGIELQGYNERFVIKNCNIHRNMGSAISGDRSTDIIIDNCFLHHNQWNGVSFATCKNITVQNCEITANSDNGIWIGTGGRDVFNGVGITIRNNFIHRQGGGRRHPDNYQMHQVRDIIIENNIFIQDGHQNMWCQYTENFTLRNNIFIGGTLGINSSMHSYIYNNVFYKSTLRYDAHTANHPEHGGFFMPQSAVIKNNIIVDSSLTYPDETLVNKEDCFDVDYNYYNIPNSWLRGSWDDERGVGFGENSIVSESSSTLSDVITQIPNEDYTQYNFYPVASSVLIDAGTIMPVSYDLEFNLRPYNARFDIGPYELSPNRGNNGYPVAVIKVSEVEGPAPLLIQCDAWHSFDSDGSIVSYSWDFGDGSPAETDINIWHMYRRHGDYQLTLTVTDDSGKTNSISITITVNDSGLSMYDQSYASRDLVCFNNLLKPGGAQKATVQINIETEEHVSVIIYDAQGRKVYALWDEVLSPGIYSREWSGTNQGGADVGSGIYFVHLKTGSKTKTKKIAVVR